MRYLVALVFTILTTNISASHFLGGEITWECVGNNQYVFTLITYQECNWAFPAGTQTINGPQGGITVNMIYMNDVAVTCNGTGGLSCYPNYPQGTGVLNKKVYKSQPTTLVGTPPPAGWRFYWDIYSRPSNAQNVQFPTGAFLYLHSTMYPSAGGCNSSPHFVAAPEKLLTQPIGSFSVLAQSDNSDDSLYYRFAPSTNSAGQPYSYINGFSASSPFPSSLSDTLNGPLVLDGATGVVSYDISSANQGLYAYVIAVEQWRNNVLISEIFRDGPAYYFTGPANNTPAVNVDTAVYPMVSYVGNDFSANTFPGDTLRFVMQCSDNDFNLSNNAFQEIRFNANGSALDSIWGGGTVFSSNASLNPVFPQTTYSGQLSNTIEFYWEIKNEHLTNGKGPHIFQFEFEDDLCPYPSRTIITLKVYVEDVDLAVSQDTVFLCSGDSAELNGYSKSGNYLWTPANDISSDTVANPIVWPSSSQYYYLTDPTAPGLIDSVYVDVTQGGSYNLAFQNGKLQTTGTVTPANVQWYYNGMPFVYPFDTLTPFGLGSYYIIAQGGNCSYLTDTVVITSGMSFATTAPGNGGHSGTIAYNAGSLGTTFQVNQNVNVQWIAIPGLVDLHGKTGTGYDLTVKVYDANENEILSKDVTLTKPFDNVLKVPVSLSLMANANYTVAITGDTAYGFSVFENVVFPSTPFNVGLTVLSANQGAAKQFPDTASNYLLPLTFGIDKTVSLPEWTNNAVVLYPNPALDEVNIYGIAEAQFLELRDVNGKLCRRTQIAKGQESIVIKRGDLPSGLYFITVQFEKGSSSQKLLLE